jgi:hypothetical protein
MSYLYLAQVSVPKEHESEFNRLYDDEHIPNLLKVQGVRAARRYKLEWGDEGIPEYLAVYELDDPNLPRTVEWKTASDRGDWSIKIRPHLTVRLHGMFRSR